MVNLVVAIRLISTSPRFDSGLVHLYFLFSGFIREFFLFLAFTMLALSKSCKRLYCDCLKAVHPLKVGDWVTEGRSGALQARCKCSDVGIVGFTNDIVTSRSILLFTPSMGRY